ncbi:MAG: hypothetical protein R3220_11075, partial [Balneolaceae bacterium]|nr:hypothetical protein [Balneolaceae bacterium]
KAKILQKRYPEIQNPNFNTATLFDIGNRKDFGSTTNFEFSSSCRTQYEFDIQECKANALIGAAACGLSAATLVGALACGAAVIAYRATCGYFAERAFDTCVLNQ